MKKKQMDVMSNSSLFELAMVLFHRFVRSFIRPLAHDAAMYGKVERYNVYVPNKPIPPSHSLPPLKLLKHLLHHTPTNRMVKPIILPQHPPRPLKIHPHQLPPHRPHELHPPHLAQQLRRRRVQGLGARPQPEHVEAREDLDVGCAGGREGVG